MFSFYRMKLRHREVKLPMVIQLESEQTIILTQAAQLQSPPSPAGSCQSSRRASGPSVLKCWWRPVNPKKQEGRVHTQAWGGFYTGGDIRAGGRGQVDAVLALSGWVRRSFRPC